MPKQMMALESDKGKANSTSGVASNLRKISLMWIKLSL